LPIVKPRPRKVSRLFCARAATLISRAHAQEIIMFIHPRYARPVPDAPVPAHKLAFVWGFRAVPARMAAALFIHPRYIKA
jgi:hypothetical protein